MRAGASSATATKVFEMPRFWCCCAIWRSQASSGALPLSNAFRSWRPGECSDEFYPSLRKGETAESRTLTYVFDRAEYVLAVHTMLESLRARAHKLHFPHYDLKVFVDQSLDSLEPRKPFPPGSSLLIGLHGEYRQPWVWVEGNAVVGPGRLLPTRGVYLRFDAWASMFGDRTGAVREGVNPADAVAAAEALAQEIGAFRGARVRIQAWNGS